MNKPSIKIIKRKDAEVMANARLQTAWELRQAAPVSREKVERHLRRKMVDTITNWISERKENNRLEKNAAIGKMFSSESLLGEG